MTAFVCFFFGVHFRKTIHDVYCVYSSPRSISKLNQSAREHIVTLPEGDTSLRLLSVFLAASDIKVTSH